MDLDDLFRWLVSRSGQNQVLIRDLVIVNYGSAVMGGFNQERYRTMESDIG